MIQILNYLKSWTVSRSVFSYLLVATLASTAVLSIVLVLSLQRVADEHPRRYLARALFDAFAVQALAPDSDLPVIGDAPMILMTPDEAGASEYAQLYRAAANDKDGIAIRQFGDHYAAVSVRKEMVAILPQFGQRISTYALFLVSVAVLAVLTTIIVIYLLIRRLTLPFDVLTQGVHSVEEGDMEFRIHLDQTFGEYRTLATGFNKMVAELQRIHESRRHMLLAIPHEILTPLARLKVRKDMIDDRDLQIQISKDISVVEELLSSILAAEKRSAGESSADFIDIEPYAQKELAELTPEGVDISIENNCAQQTAYFDGFLTGILLKNFVSNAVRYGEGKPIKVVFDRTGEGGRDLRIAVRDQGIGIAPDHLQYLMEPFWRADESRGRASGGFGIGLYLCNMIAQGLGGRIDIKSSLGEGTEISVVLPDAVCTTLEEF